MPHRPRAPEGVRLGENDPELERVHTSILALDAFEARAAGAIRGAIDDVLRGERTGVDIKNTIGDNWMIPHEAVGELCLLTLINEPAKTYSLGLVRAHNHLLNKPNQDGKRSLSTKGKATIRWIADRAQLPVSIFLRIPDATREIVWRRKSGQARINELFRYVQRVPILRADLEALAQQLDPIKRARDAKKELAKEGLLVPCGRYEEEAAKARARGIELSPYEWVCVAQ
jgi:hypothetical protein